MGFNAVIYWSNNAKISKFKGLIVTIFSSGTKLSNQKNSGGFHRKKSFDYYDFFFFFLKSQQLRDDPRHRSSKEADLGEELVMVVRRATNLA